MDEQLDPAGSFRSQGSSCNTLRHSPSYHSPTVFTIPLLLNLWHTQKMTYPGHSSNLSGFGWEMGMIPALCMAEGTWSRGGRKPCAGGGMLTSTGSMSPATPQGAQDLLYFNKTLPSYRNFNFRVVPPCPNLSLPCHPCCSAL